MIRFFALLLCAFLCNPVFADAYNYWGNSHPVGTCGTLNTASTNVTTSAWVQLVANAGSSFNSIMVANGGAQPLQLGAGASGHEAAVGIIIPPGTTVGTWFPYNASATTRLSLEAVGSTQSSGFVTICFFQ